MRPDVTSLIEACYGSEQVSEPEQVVEKTAGAEEEERQERLVKQASAEAALKLIAILDALDVAGN